MLKWNPKKNECTRKPGWREKAAATAFSCIFIVSNFLSCWSTASGMLSVFFAHHFVLSRAASFVVQMTEAAHAGRKKSKAFFAALFISVFLSAVQFTNAAYTTPAFSSLAQSSLNSTYSVELLPDIRQKLSIQMKSTRNSVFGQLSDIESALPAETDSRQTMVDADTVLSRYEQRAKENYPDDYANDANYRTLVYILDLIEQGQQDAAEQAISTAIANLDAVKPRTSRARNLCTDIRADLAALQVALTGSSSTDTAIIRESISTMRSQMMQQTEDSALLSENCDTLIDAVMRAGLNVDYASLSELRTTAAEYTQLLSLSTALYDHIAQQPHLAAQIAQADALSDEEESWRQVKSLYTEAFGTLRAELAASPLEDKADFMSKIDHATEAFLSNQTLLSKFFVVINPFHNVSFAGSTFGSIAASFFGSLLHGLSSSVPAYLSCLLALALDLAADAAASAAAKIRRHSPERLSTFSNDDQTRAA